MIVEDPKWEVYGLRGVGSGQMDNVPKPLFNQLVGLRFPVQLQ